LDPGLAGDYNPIWTYLGLAEVCAELGRLHEARGHVSQIIRIDPTFSLELVRKTSFSRIRPIWSAVWQLYGRRVWAK